MKPFVRWLAAVSLLLAPATAAAQAPASSAPVAPAEAMRRVDDAFTRAAAAGRFSGVVLVAKDGRPLFQRAYGMADRAHRIPNTLETRFNLGSMNKMFTAVAIAQLVSQGRLSFQDPVSRFLDFPTAAAARKIRVEHLLTHTSGLGSYFNARWERERPQTVAGFLEAAREDTTLAFEPGTRSQYSNTGFVVLGAIIEKVTGQDYYDYIRDHVFVPAGMAASSWPGDGGNIPNRALEYVDPRAGGDTTVDAFRRGSPAGGGVSTVADLLRFSQALLAGRLVSPEYVRILTTPKPGLPNQGYGYGFGIVPRPLLIVGHNGGKPGVFANLDIYPEQGYTTVVLMNQSAGQVQGEFVDVLRAAVESMVGLPPLEPTASGALPDGPAGRVAQALLETIRGGDTAAIRRFVGEHMGARTRARPMAEVFGMFARMRRDFGTAHVTGTRLLPGGIQVMVEGPRGRFLLDLGVDPTPPGTITGFGIEARGGGNGGDDDDDAAGPGVPPRSPAAPQRPGVTASDPLPDTPAGRAAAALLENMRGGDTAAIRRFVAERMGGRFATQPLERSMQLFARMRGDFGTAPVTGSAATPAGIQVFLDAPLGRVTLNLTIDAAPPNRITDLSVEIGQGGGDPSAPPAGPLEPAVRTAVIDSVARLLERRYPSADTGRAIGEALRRREREGAYAGLPTLSAFAAAVTTDMRSLNGDRHLNLGAGGPRRRGGGPGGGGLVLESRVLEGNVGYVRFGPLSDSPEDIARLAEAFRSLQSTGAMILDFRGAPGGSAEAANQIISHFTAPDLPSLHVVNRSEGTDFVRRTLAEVPGPRRPDVPLYVLVDSRSASAAEDVPFVLQSLGRATIVGERTAGAGRNNMIVQVGGGLQASISVSRVSDPRTGREWEAVGVTPDLAVTSADALEAARKAAVERMGRAGRH